MDWPFSDPMDVAVITVRQIWPGMAPILFVSHDAVDGGWQFLPGTEVSEQDAMVLLLSEIVDLDETIRELADLPLGWIAERQSRHSEWRRAPYTQ